MASPKLKYSNNAIITTSAKARARTAVELHKASPTATGISSAAVATRFQVIEKESPEQSPPSSHHIARNKSRKRIGQTSTNATPAGLQSVSYAVGERWGNQRHTDWQ